MIIKRSIYFLVARYTAIIIHKIDLVLIGGIKSETSKNFYEQYHRESGERITTIKLDKFFPMLERHLGKNSVFEVRLNSSSFSWKYQQYKVNARTEEGVELPMPLSFFSVVASKIKN